MRRAPHLRSVCLALQLLISCQVLAQDDPRIDADTGAERAHYPPARPFDHLHMKLEMDIPDMGKAFFTAHETLTLTPIGRGRRHLDLNAIGQTITAVMLDGQAAPYTMDKGKLSIEFPREVALGENCELKIDFSLDFTKGPREQGLTWIKPRTAEDASPTDTSPVVYSQGEAEYNRRWFPCHDFPNERLTTELVVTVEDGYTVVSNGRLIDTTLGRPGAEGRTRTVWHWLQDKPHANYLVTLVIGKYSIVGLPPTGLAEAPVGDNGRPIPCYLYAPIGREAASAAAFGNTPAMLAFYNEQFGQRYAWDKYAQVLVRGFNGGMENTSATTMMAELGGRRSAFADSIISHELGHQWFGDLMTCKSWEHAWLNEGWASYCEALWAEHAAAPDKREDAYQRTIAGFASRQRRNNTTSPDTPGMVSNRYDFAMQNFMKTNDIYSKGALVLHMLRTQLGEETFWRGVRAYIQKYKYQTVETDDFRHCLEEASGRDLERFFEQWAVRPGMPKLEADLEFKSSESGAPGGDLTVTLEQDQQIDADNPAYVLSVPIYVEYKDGSSEWLMLDTATKQASGTWTLKEKPTDVQVDPDLRNTAPYHVRKPLAMWLHQAERGRTLARLQAAEHLAEFGGAGATRALVRLLGDPGECEGVRATALRSLGREADLAARGRTLSQLVPSDKEAGR
jgi:aminopeptidase N